MVPRPARRPEDLGFEYTRYRTLHPSWSSGCVGPYSNGVSCSDLDQILRTYETPIPVEYRIQVFWTGTARGWGLRTDAFIPMHGLVIQYIGEVIPSDEMAYREQARGVKETFCLFSCRETVEKTSRYSLNVKEAAERLRDIDERGRECSLAQAIASAKRFMSDHEEDEDGALVNPLVTKEDITYGIDPLYTGNVARIINHSCDPNLKAYPLDHPPEIKETFPETEFFIPPRIAYYASRDIKVRGGRGTAPSFSLAAPRRASPGGA